MIYEFDYVNPNPNPNPNPKPCQAQPNPNPNRYIKQLYILWLFMGITKSRFYCYVIDIFFILRTTNIC